MNILILGSMNTVFLYSYERIFRRNKFNVFFANTSPLYSAHNSGIDLYTTSSRDSSKLRTIFKFLRIDRLNFLWSIFEKFEYSKSLTKEKEEELERFIIDNKIDLVFCFWGTSLKKESKSLDNIKKRLSRKLKIVLCVNTYPVRYELPKDLNDHKLKVLEKDVIYFNRFDGVICTCHNMNVLLKNKLKIKSETHVMLDFLDECFFSSKDSLPVIPNSLVFLGNVDFKKRTIDDISLTIIKLADSGINIWLQEPCNIQHNNINTFKPFTYKEITEGKLALFIRKFSASIVIYNDLDNLRTSIGYPTRFALATLSQRPILIPKGVFDAIEEYSNYNKVSSIKTFDSYDDIPRLIKNIDDDYHVEETAFISSPKNELDLLRFMKSL